MTSESHPIDVGQRLAAARLQRGLAQNDVARRAGIAPAYLSRVENGKVQPSFRVAMKIVKVLGAHPAEIMAAGTASTTAHGPCPVTARGHCLLDLIGPTSDGGRFTPAQVRLLRRFAAWIQAAEPSRLRAMEVLIEDLAGAQGSDA
jgi:transcriptional regulator with XRE-family HTH domain